MLSFQEELSNQISLLRLSRMNSVIPGAEFKRVWEKREGYVLLIKQLTSSQAILPSGKFNCARKRCNYRSISFGSEPAKDTCTSISKKSSATVQPTKPRLSQWVKPGYMWDSDFLQQNIDVGTICTDILGYPQRPGGNTVGVFLPFTTQKHFSFIVFTPQLLSQIQSPP